MQFSLTRQLQKLSDRRWACRQNAVNAECYIYDAVLGTLLEASNIFEGAEAKGLLLQVFLVHSMHDRLVTCAKGLSDVQN